MRGRIARNLLLILFSVAISPTAIGVEELTIVGVEEDWEFVLAVPDPLKASPQIITWMSPTDSLDDIHFGVDLNHVQRPDFASGGFQTKAMIGGEIFDNKFSENGQNLVNDGETVRWTQRMFLNDHSVTFELTNGTSQSWGTFGGGNSRVRISQSSLTNLNQYNPLKSVEWSGVGYAANRVSHFRLLTVRLYSSNGQVQTLSLQADVE
jgi:hypothetical protein